MTNKSKRQGVPINKDEVPVGEQFMTEAEHAKHVKIGKKEGKADLEGADEGDADMLDAADDEDPENEEHQKNQASEKYANQGIERRNEQNKAMPDAIINVFNLKSLLQEVAKFWETDEKAFATKHERKKAYENVCEIQKLDSGLYPLPFETLEVDKREILAIVEKLSSGTTGTSQYMMDWANAELKMTDMRKRWQENRATVKWAPPTTVLEMHGLEKPAMLPTLPGKSEMNKKKGKRSVRIDEDQNTVRSFKTNRTTRTTASSFHPDDKRTFHDILGEIKGADTQILQGDNCSAEAWQRLRGVVWLIVKQTSATGARWRFQAASESGLPDITKDMTKSIADCSIAYDEDFHKGNLEEIVAVAWKDERYNDHQLNGLYPRPKKKNLGALPTCYAQVKWKDGSMTWETRTAIRRLIKGQVKNGGRRIFTADKLLYEIAGQAECTYDEEEIPDELEIEREDNNNNNDDDDDDDDKSQRSKSSRQSRSSRSSKSSNAVNRKELDALKNQLNGVKSSSDRKEIDDLWKGIAEIKELIKSLNINRDEKTIAS